MLVRTPPPTVAMAGDTGMAVLVSLLGAFGDPDPGARASAHAAFAVAARAAPRAACTAACEFAAAVRQRAARSTGRVAADPGVLEALRSVTHALTDAPAGSVDPDTRRGVRGIATGATRVVLAGRAGSVRLVRRVVAAAAP
jgi:hypothetical protein